MTYADPNAVFDIVNLAGGRIVGRTRLQKCTCGLELTGLGYGFSFSYKHFGPYSEDLKIACNDADALGLVREQRKTATWGGEYSAFVAAAAIDAKSDQKKRPARELLLQIMASADPIALELAITAAYLAAKGVRNPWSEVEERKQEKATPNAVKSAKKLYREMQSVRTPTPLPDIL